MLADSTPLPPAAAEAARQRHLHLLVVEDDAEMREALETTLLDTGITVRGVADGRQALAAIGDAPVDAVLTDVQMPNMDGHELLRRIRRRNPQLPVILMTAYGSIERAVEAMRDGASDYLRKGFDVDTLLQRIDRLRSPQPAVVPMADDSDDDAPIARAANSLKTRAIAKRVAVSNATVLLSGESGTGKEVIARYIHAQSPRADQPFVAINCAAIPESMLEAMLFGHEKGAFTGATQATPGKFEQAQGGTLLLDEISEMPLSLQPKLLRVLQESEVERVGGRRMLRLDVRIIATTNRELRGEVSAGRFREDLYYRLSVMPIPLSPLRERREDILPLFRHMLLRHADGRAAPRLSPCAEHFLCQYDWPGNVRELDNLANRTLILCSGDEITAQDLNVEGVDDGVLTPAVPASRVGELKADMEVVEQQRILQVIASTRTRKEAAEQLGVAVRTLRHKLQKMREQGVDVSGASGT
ncbi:MAG: sigma-54 dependent transcriptional regulator [Pseudomonadota bacterium]